MKGIHNTLSSEEEDTPLRWSVLWRLSGHTVKGQSSALEAELDGILFGPDS